MLLTTDLAQLRADGCELVDPIPVFLGLMQATNNDPCTTGCAYYDGGKCPAYRKHHSKMRGSAPPPPASNPLLGGKWKGMSIKDIAKEQGISLNEVKRRRDRGEYKA